MVTEPCLLSSLRAVPPPFRSVMDCNDQYEYKSGFHKEHDSIYHSNMAAVDNDAKLVAIWILESETG